MKVDQDKPPNENFDHEKQKLLPWDPFCTFWGRLSPGFGSSPFACSRSEPKPGSPGILLAKARWICRRNEACECLEAHVWATENGTFRFWCRSSRTKMCSSIIFLKTIIHIYIYICLEETPKKNVLHQKTPDMGMVFWYSPV